MDGAEEQRILELAQRKGLISKDDMSAVCEDAGREDGNLRGPYTPRINRLLRHGRIDIRTLRALMHELAASERTHDAGRKVETSLSVSISPVHDDLLSLPEAGTWDRYQLRERIGSGGMGTVYRAHDHRLGREVALKFMRRSDPKTTRRFVREARSQARIQHPAVCQIFDAGEFAGLPYIAMEYLAGAPLHAVASQMNSEQTVWCVREVALALQAAHALRIVHRDVKPQNIMAKQNPNGGWQVKVLDFGLSLDHAQIDSLTESGAILGTPAYMSPEQAAGHRSVDLRCDVFGLGAVLYQLLTGTPPFGGRTPAEVVHNVLHEDPLPPRAINGSVPRDLEMIVLKCLRKEPGLRYQSAQALADDLGRYLQAQPIEAARWSWAYKARQVAKRHRLWFAVTVVALGGLAGSLAVSVRERHRADRRVAMAQQLGREVEQIELFLRRAHQLPLHNIQTELDEMHVRIRRIVAKLDSLEPAEAGLAELAIGRAYLALGSFEIAAEHIRAALRHDPTDNSARYDLGLALGSLYQSKLGDVERLGDPSLRAKRERELRAQYLAPAQECFRAAQQDGWLRLDSPEYGEAIVAFHNNDSHRAIELSQVALRKQPWRFEVQRFLGDVFYRRAQQQVVIGNLLAARTELQRSIEQYRAAAALAPSDPAMHVACADAWLTLARLEALRGASSQEAFEETLAACRKLAAVQPQDSRRTMIEYRVHFSQAYQNLHQGAPALSFVSKALAAAEECLALLPKDPLCHDAVSTAWSLRGYLAIHAGQDAEQELDQAEKHAESAVTYGPQYARVWLDFGAVKFIHSMQQLRRRGDAVSFYQDGLSAMRKARDMDPAQFTCNETVFQGIFELADGLVKQGKSARWLLSDVRDWKEKGDALGCHTFLTHEYLGRYLALLAEYENLSSEERVALIQKGIQELNLALGSNPLASNSRETLRKLQHLLATRPAPMKDQTERAPATGWPTRTDSTP